MKSASTLREFSDQEKELLMGYVMAYAADVTKSFRLVEQQMAPNLTVHYAVPCTDSPLATKQLDSLGDYAITLRDNFKKIIADQNIRIREVGVAVQLLQGRSLLGVVQLNSTGLSVQNPDEKMELQVYLPDSETTAPTD